MFCIEKLIVIFFTFRLNFFHSKVCKYSFPLIFAYSSREISVQGEGHATVCAVVNQLQNWCFYFTKIYFSLFQISLLLSRLTTALAVLSHFQTSLIRVLSHRKGNRQIQFYSARIIETINFWNGSQLPVLCRDVCNWSQQVIA